MPFYQGKQINGHWKWQLRKITEWGDDKKTRTKEMAW